MTDCGALIISLDFELHWGVRDTRPANGTYRRNLLGARDAVPAMLALFDEFDVAATWATVGFLFARSRAQLESWRPRMIPSYANVRLDAYAEPVGDDESSDPIHYAPTLIRRIQTAGRHEIATHTYSHYYCLEPGQSDASLRADLESASTAARQFGVELRSIVFPRNQHNPEYDPALLDAGLVAYRGVQRGWQHDPDPRTVNRPGRRVARAFDSYIAMAPTDPTSWSEIRQPNGLCNIPANAFVRPFLPQLRHLEPLRRSRITRVIERAARERNVVHIWWHPHNFGTHLTENLRFLRGLLECHATWRDREGMRSLTMIDAARLVSVHST